MEPVEGRRRRGKRKKRKSPTYRHRRLTCGRYRDVLHTGRHIYREPPSLFGAVRCPLSAVLLSSVRPSGKRRRDDCSQKEKKRKEKSRSPRSPIGGRRPPSKLGSAWVRRKRTRAWAGERKKKKRGGGGGGGAVTRVAPAGRPLAPCVDTPHRPPSIIQRSVHPSIHPPIHRSARRPVVGRAATQPQSPEGGGDVIRRKR